MTFNLATILRESARDTPPDLPAEIRPFDELYRVPDTRDIAPRNAAEIAVPLYTRRSRSERWT